VVTKLQPKREWVKRRAVFEYGDKQVTQLTSSLHSAGLLQTCEPLSIIIQKASQTTGITKSRSLNPLESAQISKGSGTLDCSEQSPEVEAFS
jgi:hypothetical protein